MKKAFTLVEVIITVSILAAVSGIGMARMVDFNEQKTLSEAGKSMVSDINNARHSALTGEKDTVICNDPAVDLSGWCVSPNTTTSTYKKYGVCGIPPSITPFPRAADIPSYSLPRGVTLRACSNVSGTWQTDAGGGKVLFRPLGQQVLFANDTVSEVMYCLQSGFAALGATRYYRIRITSSGEIIDEGIQTNCLCP